MSTHGKKLRWMVRGGMYSWQELYLYNRRCHFGGKLKGLESLVSKHYVRSQRGEVDFKSDLYPILASRGTPSHVSNGSLASAMVVISDVDIWLSGCDRIMSYVSRKNMKLPPALIKMTLR